MLAEIYTEKAMCKTKMLIAAKLKNNKPHQKARKTADCIQEKKKRSCTSTAIQRKSSESEYDADTVCLYCSETYSKTAGEGWIQCTTCRDWAHDHCAGVDEDDVEFLNLSVNCVCNFKL